MHKVFNSCKNCFKEKDTSQFLVDSEPQTVHPNCILSDILPHSTHN